MHIVEVCREGEGLAGPMAQMRTWLDGIGIQPLLFQMSLMAHATIFRLQFQRAREARAFARAFGGQITTEPDDHPIAA